MKFPGESWTMVELSRLKTAFIVSPGLRGRESWVRPGGTVTVLLLDDVERVTSASDFASTTANKASSIYVRKSN